jgi:capsular polysaccharide biosynthesis protein
VPLLVDEVCFRIPQYIELLTLLNEKGRKLIPVKKDHTYLVNRLYVVSCPNYLPPNYVKIYEAVPSDFLYDLSSLSYLRTALIPASGNISTPAKLFISRRKASRRRTYNEDEVFQVLQELGFEKIHPENYSFTDQVQLFNNADFIIGGSGAAFSNLIFCRQTCKVICLTNYNFPLSIFSTIASFIGLELTYMYDSTLSYAQTDDLHHSFTVDVIRLKSIVSQWF